MKRKFGIDIIIGIWFEVGGYGIPTRSVKASSHPKASTTTHSHCIPAPCKYSLWPWLKGDSQVMSSENRYVWNCLP